MSVNKQDVSSLSHEALVSMIKQVSEVLTLTEFASKLFIITLLISGWC